MSSAGPIYDVYEICAYMFSVDFSYLSCSLLNFESSIECSCTTPAEIKYPQTPTKHALRTDST